MKDWVPLFQTLIWVGLIIGVLLIFRVRISMIVDALTDRVVAGSSLRVGPIEVGELREELLQVRREVNDLSDKVGKLFLATMSEAMYLNLKKLASGNFGRYDMSSALERELYHLRDIGYISVHSVKSIPPSGENLSHFIRVTEGGHEFVKLRESLVG